MKKRRSQEKRPSPRAVRGRTKVVKMASRRPKANEVASDSSLRSSLTQNITIGRPEDVSPLRAGQSGDIQGLSAVESADSESVEELIEDGQAYEAEIIEGVEDAPDEQEVPRRGRIENELPIPFENRNKI